MDQEQINKIRQYLLDQGQQELVGHFDGLVQQFNQATNQTQPATTPDEPATGDQSTDTPLTEGEQPAPSAQQFQEQAKGPNNPQ